MPKGRYGAVADGAFIPYDAPAESVVTEDSVTAEEHIGDEAKHLTQAQADKLAGALTADDLAEERDARVNADNDLQTQLDAQDGQTRRYFYWKP